MLGHLPGVNGLKGDEYNLVNTSDPQSERVTVNTTSPYVGACVRACVRARERECVCGCGRTCCCFRRAL